MGPCQKGESSDQEHSLAQLTFSIIAKHRYPETCGHPDVGIGIEDI